MQTAGSSEPGPVSSANTGRGVGSGNSTCCRGHGAGGGGLRGGVGGAWEESQQGASQVFPGPSVWRDAVQKLQGVRAQRSEVMPP